MGIVKEFRVTLPLTVDEYQVGQLYTVAEASKAETGGGDGVEVLKNEPFSDHPEYGTGQYTKKIYHLKHKVPGWIQAIAPTGSLELYEEAWNAFPFCKTILTNPDYMGNSFRLCITTWHKADRGDLENVHNLSGKLLKDREVVHVNIAKDHCRPADYKKEFDPKEYHHPRGPLADNFNETCKPVMTCYKLVEIDFKWRLIGGKVESFISDVERRLFFNFHRQVFCTHYKWADMTMEKIREIEEETKRELDEQRKKGGLKGTTDKSY